MVEDKDALGVMDGGALIQARREEREAETTAAVAAGG